jgi:hypothetical protein
LQGVGSDARGNRAVIGGSNLKDSQMRSLFLAATAAASLVGGALAGAAQAEQSPRLIFGVDRNGETPALDKVQYIYGGQNYCWYTGGWQGPGFYQCGFAWRVGFGWGGGYGWRGWGGGYAHGWRGGGQGYAGGRGNGQGYANVSARNAGSYGRPVAGYAGGARGPGARVATSRGVTRGGGGQAASRGGGGHAVSRGGGGGNRRPG